MIDRLTGQKEAMRRKLGKRMVDEYGDAVMAVLTTAETRLLETVADHHRALGLDPVDVPDQQQRADRLRELWLALFEGRFPAFWVEHYADLDNPDEAAQFADADPEEWQTTKREWADRLRRNGLEGTDDELAAGHVRKRYGVSLAEFEGVVVEWPDGRAGEELEAIVAGPVEQAVAGIEHATEHVQEASADA